MKAQSLKSTQIWTVAKWEFLHFFKLKQEIISKLIMLVIAGVIYFFAANNQQLEQSYTIATDTDFTLNAGNSQQSNFNFIPVNDLDHVIKNLNETKEYDAVIRFNSPDGRVSLITAEKASWQLQLSSLLSTELQHAQFNKLNLTQEQQLGLRTQVLIEHQVLDELLKNQADKSQTYTAFGVLILLFIAMFGVFGQLFVSITGEKQNRVTEQIMATMTPQTWIDGKLTGQILLAVKTMVGTLLSIVLSMLFFTVVIKQQAIDLHFVNWALLPWFFAFAIAGLAICAAFMAAIAAGIDDPNHSSKSALMMLPIAPIVIAFFVMDAPNSILTVILSYLPITAFAVMPVRMSLVELPLWQPLLSLVLSIGCFYYLRIVAARIFKMGMNMYGKEPSLKAMWSAIFK
ncbi:ABC transporter permease [Pseudoalteromonas sp. NEC-BIFX-2020_002]|uniref:ABC transporter permease n=1 Tax=Pseudoalteromonas sp. NEC-BIFX-2020_002 TaxID=2732353 RepID=UPI0014773A0A|nr:ABC transporter permease [Pseudoalteromonas sp. NEC-BIFX-2020_002]NNG44894.1 ABC transporter permease [Pseudoalteromonas sp. NEC-BIFX-2020_002]